MEHFARRLWHGCDLRLQRSATPAAHSLFPPPQRLPHSLQPWLPASCYDPVAASSDSMHMKLD